MLAARQGHAGMPAAIVRVCLRLEGKDLIQRRVGQHHIQLAVPEAGAQEFELDAGDGPGGHMQDAGQQFTGHFVHVGDHQ